MGRKWNEQDVEYLKRNYETSSLSYLSKVLGRSRSSIKNRAYGLGLVKDCRWDAWKEKETDILIEYFPSASHQELLSKLNRDWQSIVNKASKLGLNRNVREIFVPEDAWKQWEIEFIKEHYPISTKQVILDKINRTWAAIRTKAIMLGIKRQTRARLVSSINHYYFDKWSNDMAYILGFISADGNISKNFNKMSIGLAAKDEQHLCNIRDAVAPKNKISYHTRYKNDKEYKYVRIEVCSKYMCQQINRLGVPPKKSLILTFPPNMPVQYERHFIRGNFDGDGCITGTGGSCSMYFLGTQQLLESINNIIHRDLGISKKNVRRVQRHLHILKYSVLDTIKIGKWLYGEGGMKLDRKFERFQKLFEERGV